MSIGVLLCHLEGPLFRCTAALRRASRGLRRAAGVRLCAHASAPHFDRRRSTHACVMRAPCRADWSRSMSNEKPLCHPKGPFSRCTTVLRCTSCGLRPPVGECVCVHANAPPRARSREEAQHARSRRACAAPPLLGVGSCPIKAHCTSEADLFSVHGRALTYQPWPPTSSRRLRVRTLERATRFSLGRRRSTRACGVRAPHRTGRSGTCSLEAHCAIETALFLGARTCSDVPAAASDDQPAFACAHTRTRYRALSHGRRRSTRACFVRALRRR